MRVRCRGASHGRRVTWNGRVGSVSAVCVRHWAWSTLPSVMKDIQSHCFTLKPFIKSCSLIIKTYNLKIVNVTANRSWYKCGNLIVTPEGSKKAGLTIVLKTYERSRCKVRGERIYDQHTNQCNIRSKQKTNKKFVKNYRNAQKFHKHPRKTLIKTKWERRQINVFESVSKRKMHYIRYFNLGKKQLQIVWALW